MDNRKKDFDVFKSNVCHTVKTIGDLEFVEQTINDKTIERYFVQKQYAESLYLLAMVDYLCRIHQKEVPSQYADLRKMKLKQPVYPKSLLLLAHLSDDKEYIRSILRQSIPEFRRFNIIEGDVHDIV